MLRVRVIVRLMASLRLEWPMGSCRIMRGVIVMGRHKTMRVVAVFFKNAMKKAENRMAVKTGSAGSVWVIASSAVRALARVRAVRMFKCLYFGIDYSALVGEDGFPVCF